MVRHVSPQRVGTRLNKAACNRGWVDAGAPKMTRRYFPLHDRCRKCSLITLAGFELLFCNYSVTEDDDLAMSERPMIKKLRASRSSVPPRYRTSGEILQW